MGTPREGGKNENWCGRGKKRAKFWAVQRRGGPAEGCPAEGCPAEGGPAQGRPAEGLGSSGFRVQGSCFGGHKQKQNEKKMKSKMREETEKSERKRKTKRKKRRKRKRRTEQTPFVRLRPISTSANFDFSHNSISASWPKSNCPKSNWPKSSTLVDAPGLRSCHR